jgi:hypothetical protein
MRLRASAMTEIFVALHRASESRSFDEPEIVRQQRVEEADSRATRLVQHSMGD